MASPEAAEPAFQPEVELLEGARQQGIANLADVEIAVLEPDGRFSFITWDRAHHPSPERHQA